MVRASFLFLIVLLTGCSYPDTLPKPQPPPPQPAKPFLLPPLDPPAQEALDEVNATRAKRGLSPFLWDYSLTVGAMKAASYRADHRIEGHTRNDFDFLPLGTTAKASGCGALDDSWGWASCCTYDHYTYAGAAWSRGKDNKRYMSLFVQ